jgi:hypothetical protein
MRALRSSLGHAISMDLAGAGGCQRITEVPVRNIGEAWSDKHTARRLREISMRPLLIESFALLLFFSVDQGQRVPSRSSLLQWSKFHPAYHCSTDAEGKSEDRADMS